MYRLTEFDCKWLMERRKQSRRLLSKRKEKAALWQRKVSSLFNISSLFPSISFIFTAAAALPPPLELFSPAMFAIGDLVQSIPNTTPGGHLSHSIAIVGTIEGLKIEGGWLN